MLVDGHSKRVFQRIFPFVVSSPVSSRSPLDIVVKFLHDCAIHIFKYNSPPPFPPTQSSQSTFPSINYIQSQLILLFANTSPESALRLLQSTLLRYFSIIHRQFKLYYQSTFDLSHPLTHLNYNHLHHLRLLHNHILLPLQTYIYPTLLELLPKSIHPSLRYSFIYFHRSLLSALFSQSLRPKSSLVRLCLEPSLVLVSIRLFKLIPPENSSFSSPFSFSDSLNSSQLEKSPNILPLPSSSSSPPPSILPPPLSPLLVAFSRVQLVHPSTLPYLLAPTFSLILDLFITSHHLKVDWLHRRSVLPLLSHWVSSSFLPFITYILNSLCSPPQLPPLTLVSPSLTPISQPNFTLRLPSPSFSSSALTNFLPIATSRLAKLRSDSLLSLLHRYPLSHGALLDLKHVIHSPVARQYLIHSFVLQLQQYLLHSSTPTSYILDLYALIIRGFSQLDPKLVLLDYVAKPIRHYLQTRNDTARVIIASLIIPPARLSRIIIRDPLRTHLFPHISVQIAREFLLSSPTKPPTLLNNLDWSNLQWAPDPVDAEPEYRRSKLHDVLSSLLSLYDRDDFISHLKVILGHHLLRSPSTHLAREIRLVELFKQRLSDDKLQACEVMLHDVTLSRQLRTHLLAHTKVNNLAILNPLIISSYFWPTDLQLFHQSIALPTSISQLHSAYLEAFTRIKPMRSLQWFSAVGSADIELIFSDRVWRGICTIPQATLIHLYATPVSSTYTQYDDSMVISYSLRDLQVKLSLPEKLINQAITFWVNRRVLSRQLNGEIILLERLPLTASSGPALISLSSEPGSMDKDGDHVMGDELVSETLNDGNGNEDIDENVSKNPAGYTELKPSNMDDGSPGLVSFDRETTTSTLTMPTPILAPVSSASAPSLQQSKMIHQFILGMLTNHGAMQPEKILLMLKLTLPGGFSHGSDGLFSILRQLKRQGSIEQRGDSFVLSSNSSFANKTSTSTAPGFQSENPG